MTIQWDEIAKPALPPIADGAGPTGCVIRKLATTALRCCRPWPITCKTRLVGAQRILKLAYDDTVDKGMAWVLARMVIHVRRYPGNGEEIIVETWPSGVARRVATRDFRLIDGKGDVIAVAQSFWVMFDLLERRAASWPDWIEERLPKPPARN